MGATWFLDCNRVSKRGSLQLHLRTEITGKNTKGYIDIELTVDKCTYCVTFANVLRFQGGQDLSWVISVLSTKCILAGLIFLTSRKV